MEQEVVDLQATVTEQFGRSKNTSSVSVVKGINLRGVKEGAPLLYIVNGKEVSKEYLSTIETERIKSISILKNESGTEIYGDKGKNGVIIITLYTEDEFQARKKNAEK
ncbi:TonB-dependent receptor plug domain-containing protein [uncultured Bacteroides sp.]|uniref:TonB-dependent receptor plug domain-containing protein n=1 Tax=uncultured Bacteroides sp. TaxID=162156 RepID=UPI0025E6B75F|nr:TonB-dependent receptor plug domain-containing protein [uncultured Bacteroides sp.]